MKESKVVMLVTNDVSRDIRVRKESQSAANAGFEVVVIGCRSQSVRGNENWMTDGGQVVRVLRVTEPLTAGGHPLVRKVRHYWGMRRIQGHLAAAALSERPDVVHANDLDTLPSAIAVARMSGARVVYDAHELYTEMFDRPHAGPIERALIASQKYVLRKQEARLAPRADAVFTVNPFIASELARRYSITLPGVVLNVPPAQTLHALPLPDLPRPIFLYQGGLTKGRGLPEIVDNFGSVRSGSLVLMGAGPLAEELAARAASTGLTDRVTVLPPVAPEDVVRVAASADIGVIPYVAGSLNNYYSSPNKLFDYLHAGLAIVATNLPFVAQVLSETGAGMVANTDSAVDLAGVMDRLADNPAQLETFRQASAAAAQRYTWEREVAPLIEAYRRLAMSKPRTGV